MAKITPPSSPMMTVPPAEAPPETPRLTDDVMDPPVPPGTIDVAPVPPEASMLTPPTVTIPDVLVPLAHGFCQYLQSQVHTFLGEEHRQLQASVDASLAAVRHWAEGMLQGNEHAQYTLGDALARLHEHGTNLVHAKADPYTAVIDARTPHGFPLRLTIEKPTSGELIEELGRVEGWLVQNGYQALEAVS